LIGSQIRKLAIADISEDAEFELYGEKFNKQELLDLYHSITSTDLEQDYDKIAERFNSVENIQDLLLTEIIDRDMGEEREKAVKLVPRLNKVTGLMEKVFNLPLFHPYHAKSNESLMNSVFKNNVTKQKIKGGAFVQVSAFGFDKDLKLNINDGRLISAECKLPWWSKKYFEPMLDENGQLDINKVPENLREMIGYRIPTEDKYSMLPLIVTGFLPASAGGAVMLPMEITTISGSDFDIDKMYIMMPEWEASEDGKDIRKVQYDLSKNAGSKEILSPKIIIDSVSNSRLLEEMDRRKNLFQNIGLIINMEELGKIIKNRDDEFPTLSKFVRRSQISSGGNILGYVDGLRATGTAKIEEKRLLKDLGLSESSDVILFNQKNKGYISNEDIETIFHEAAHSINPLDDSEILTKEEWSRIHQGQMNVGLLGGDNAFRYNWTSYAKENPNIETIPVLAGLRVELYDQYFPERILKILDSFNSEKQEAQSKEARNNAKIDIIRAVLTHSDTFAKIFKPGGFPTLSELADRVLKLEGKADEMLPMTLPSTQAELFNRNMTGKALIGIFANHNTSHAILQNTQIELKEGISFDIATLRSLHKITNKQGEFISRNVAEWLAAVVDNAKNPLSAFINVNTYTADVAATLTRLGYPLETVVGFLSQPILKEFSTRYFNNGANRQAEIKITKEIQELLKTNNAKNRDLGIITEKMYEAIETGKIYTDFQAEIFDTFISAKEQATALADLVRATRADTKGAGPTLSENDKLLRLRTQVLTNQALTGVQELFDGIVYPMEKAFTEFGVEKPTEILSKYFPWFNPAWTNVKNRIENDLKGKQLSVKQIEQINYELLGYAASGFEFFDGRDRADVINNMAKKLYAIKEQYPKEFAENYFLNKLIVKSDEKHPTRPKTINFKNTGSLTEQDKQQVKENWLYLLRDDKFSTFARELIKYSFYSAGFQITPNSFNHLIPVDFYSNLVDSNGQTFNEYLDKTMAESESENILNGFIDQFYKNNSDDSSFVPMVDTDKFSNITGGINYLKGKPAYFEVNAADKSTTNDFVIKVEEKIATFSPFVSMKEKGVVYLYKANQVSPMKAVYTLTNKLGVPNQVLEYVKGGVSYSAIGENNPFIGFTESDVNANVPEKNRTAISETASNEVEDVDYEDVTEVKPVNIADSMAEITNHSGGALGADTAWDKIGSKYGMTKNRHYYFEGFKTPNGNTSIPVVQKDEANDKLKQANKFLNRTFPTSKEYINNLLRRNWWQVKNSDAIFAVSNIKWDSRNEKGLVEGGTAWAVYMAISEGKPVHVFDQNSKEWYQWQYNAEKDTGWVVESTPTLTKDFAGIGTREINKDGLKAIEDVYIKTQQSFNTNTKPVDEYAEITESIRAKVLNELKNDDTLGEYLGVTEAQVNTMNIEELGDILNKICNR